ncbi:putative proteinase inhibitor I13, potato inhibitor I [Medicago truncatula]|uniref:Inhibitor of trypsin and hageman factor-like protein n=2 Tax=Medicago truncatula TaxID=3880 RepID=A0A396JS51_MEDTR|nr:putative proteinase inhibitor I13, potato inhibitor I [Medicago truncatula]
MRRDEGRCLGKNEWPEVVGMDGDEAVEKIERENHRVNAIVVPEGSLVPMNFKCTRVWVWVDKEGKVFRVPKIG